MLRKEQVQFPILERELRNKKTRETCKFTMRPFRRGDESGVIACIRDEYADSYFKRDFYDPKKLRDMASGEHYVFFVAETQGQIAGMEIFVLFTEDGDDYIEPASQILRAEYRGYGLAGELVSYTFPLAKAMRPAALFVHAVTFHEITQKLCAAQGMIPTGFRLGSFLAEKMHNSYPKGLCPKHSEGIMILPVEKQTAGTVYIPQELFLFASRCYDRLGLAYELSDCREELPATPAVLSVTTDELQRTVYMRVKKSGADLEKQVQTQMRRHKQPYWTYQIMISSGCGYAIAEYEILSELGFFFSGIRAACGAAEQIYMQWCGGLELHMDEYVLTENFDELRGAINDFYDRRKKV